MLTRIHACPIDGPIRNALKESLHKNFVAQNGLSLAKSGKSIHKNENWLLKVTQLFVKSVMSSSNGRSLIEIVGGRQVVLPRIIDPPYVRKSPQTRTIIKKWKWKSDIFWAGLEEALKWLKKWVDKKRHPLTFMGEIRSLLNCDLNILGYEDTKVVTLWEDTRD